MPPAAEPQGHERRWTVFAVVVLGAFMAQLDLFIVNIAFPAISRDFSGASSASMAWVLDAYAIVFAACLVPAGRLGDLVGRRRTFEAGIGLFALGSLGCAVAPSVAVLIAARVLQAVGGALVIPTSLGLLLHAFPPAERAGATGAWASAGAVAAASGPPIGGLLVQADWRWIFIVNIPLAAVALLGSRRFVEEVRHPDVGGRPDVIGIGLLLAGIGGLVLCIVEGSRWGWSSSTFVLALVASIALLAAFLRRCARHPSPVVELTLLRLRPFAVANAVMLAFYVGFGAMLLGSVLMLTGIWHESTVIAGLEISPGPLCVAIISPRVRGIVARFGARPVAVAGCVAFALGTAWWRWRIGAGRDYASAFLPGMLAGGIGVGLTQATLYGVVAGVLPPARFATGSGVLNMSRQIGLALGVAVLVAIIGSAPGVAGFHGAYALMAGAGLVAAALALGLPRRPVPRPGSALAHGHAHGAATTAAAAPTGAIGAEAG